MTPKAAYMLSGNVSRLRPQAPTLAVLAETYVRHRLGQRTLSALTARNQRSVLRIFAEVVAVERVEQLSSGHVETWLEAVGALRPSTRRGHYSTVRTFCRWLVREGYVATDPTVGVPAPRQPRLVPRAIDADRVAALLDACPDARGRAIVWLMVGMGLRCCEVARLEVGHWDRRGAVMTVRGKGGHERVLPVPAETSVAVAAYLAEVGETAGPLIRSYRRPAHGLAADTISGMVSEWMRAAGVKGRPRDGISAHALRATAASDVLEVCGDLRVVQEMLGHANLATTSIYLRRGGLGKLRAAMSGRRYVTPPGAA